MRITGRTVHFAADETITPEALAGMVGDRYPWSGDGEAEVVEAELVGGWLVLTVEVPDDDDKLTGLWR
jgi:hypothetical protein